MMGKIDNHRLPKSIRNLLSCALVCIFFASGCAQSPKHKQSERHRYPSTALLESGLKKQVGIVPFENATVFTKESFDKILQKEVVDMITSECTGIRILQSADLDWPALLAGSKQETSPKIDNIAFAELGRKLGANAFLFGRLAHISEKMEKEGILWFKDTVYYVQIGVRVEVYDTETGSKLLDESVIREIEIDEIDVDLLRKGDEINIPGVLETIVEMGQELADMACDTIKNTPWKAYITGVSGDKVILSSGQKSGIKTGQRFKVYNRGKLIEGKAGMRFYLPGTEIGEIKIISVFPNHAEAISESGEAFPIGASVRRG